MIKKIVFVLLFSLNLAARKYTEHELSLHGVSIKDNMPHCQALEAFVVPYDYKPDVSKCAYASKLKTICDNNPHARWQFGRCFCPQSNTYYDRHPYSSLFIKGLNLSDETDPEQKFRDLEKEINKCGPFTPREHPYGRSIYLVPQSNFFIAHKMTDKSKWFNSDDVPAPQGSPTYVAHMMTLLNLPLGFGFIDAQPVIPTFDTLASNLSRLALGIDFFEVEQELAGKKYLEEFAERRLPISRIDQSNDATFFLHDMDYHVIGFLLLPPNIRELARWQTHYLLDFVKFFTRSFDEGKHYPYNLMLNKMVEYQIQTIDGATGNLILSLKNLSEHSKSFEEYKQTLMSLDKQGRKDLHEPLLAITWSPGLLSRNNVASFLADFNNLLEDLFEEEVQARYFLASTLKIYIDTKNKYEKNFRTELKVDKKNPSHETYGVDLYLEWIEDLYQKGTALKASKQDCKNGD